ncbi:unnamed protein product [Mucor circinelloides]
MQVAPSSLDPINACQSTKQELPPADQPLHAVSTSIDIPSSSSALPDSRSDKPTHRKPSLLQLLLSTWQFFAAIGVFGFQVDATPVSSSCRYFISNSSDMAVL